jgi:integrase
MLAMATRTATKKKSRGVFEKVPGSGVWWIQFYANGKRKREKVGRKSDAVALYQQRKAHVARGVKLPANMRHKGERLSEVIDRALGWYKEHKPKAYRSAKTHLERVKGDLGERVAADLTPHDIDVWLSRLTREPGNGYKQTKPESLTQATKNRYKATLGRALQLAVKSGHLQRNAARLVEARKENNTRERYLSADEESRIVAAIEKNYPGYLPAFIIALHTGMRQGEQFTMTWSMVDFESRKIRLPQTKNGKAHTVHLNQTAYNALQSLYKARPETCDTDRVFLSHRYKCQPLENPRQWFTDVCSEAEVENIKWHDLRHTFASRLVQKGVSLQTVSKLANHGSIAITMRYAHLASEQLDDAVAMLDS